MLWRILLGYPLGNTDPVLTSAMVNLVGAPNHAGNAVYEGLDQILSIGHCFVHIYGKEETRPGRKMGHVTIVNENLTTAKEVARKIQNTLKVKSI